jgi:hypothetical protein
MFFFVMQQLARGENDEEQHSLNVNGVDVHLFHMQGERMAQKLDRAIYGQFCFVFELVQRNLKMQFVSFFFFVFININENIFGSFLFYIIHSYLFFYILFSLILMKMFFKFYFF